MAAGGSDDTGACDHYIVGRAFITVDNANIMNIDPLGYAVGIKNKLAANGSSRLNVLIVFICGYYIWLRRYA